MVDRLQEISASASKEFALEKAMGKMKDEWEHVRFACQPYRESGVSILAGVDDIQVKILLSNWLFITYTEL